MVGIIRNYRGLPRSIYVLTFARFVNSIGSFVYPFLTLFLTKKIGLSAGEAGTFAMISAFASIPGNFFGGHISDRIGRKKVLLLFQFLASACFIPCAFLGNSMYIPYLLILASAFGGVAAPVSGAMVTDLTNPDNRKQSFSLLYLGMNLGVAIGTYVAGLLFYDYTMWIFLGDFITTFLSLILVAMLVSESKPTEEEIKEMHEESQEKAESGSVLSALFKRPLLLGFAIASAILSFVYAQHAFGMPLQLTEIFGEKKGASLFGSLMPINALVVVFCTVTITTLTQKFKPIWNMSIAGILYAIGFGSIYFINSYPLFIASTVVWTIGEIMAVTNSGVYIANHTPITHRGRFNAVIPLITGTGYVTSMKFMGNYIDAYGVRQVWILMFALGLAGAAFMYVLYLSERASKKHA